MKESKASKIYHTPHEYTEMLCNCWLERGELENDILDDSCFEMTPLDHEDQCRLSYSSR